MLYQDLYHLSYSKDMLQIKTVFLKVEWLLKYVIKQPAKRQGY